MTPQRDELACTHVYAYTHSGNVVSSAGKQEGVQVNEAAEGRHSERQTYRQADTDMTHRERAHADSCKGAIPVSSFQNMLRV